MIQRQILIAGLLALLLATATGYFAASALARRVKRLERAAGEVAAGNFSEPIPIDSEDELGQLARAFNEMQHRLARLDTARKEFIANASHELRTPIFSLGGFVELLQDEELDEETRAEFLTTMREQVDRLQKLTTDLLDLSRLDAGSIDLELEPVPLRTLANQVAGEFAAAAARKDAEIDVVDRESQVDIEAVCDPERVAQIVRVLIDNALVHTPDGNPHHDRRPPRVASRAPAEAAELLVDRRRPRNPQARPRARLRALPHQRLGLGLGPRARDRARAGAAHAGRPRGHARGPGARPSRSHCRSRASASSPPRPQAPPAEVRA